MAKEFNTSVDLNKNSVLNGKIDPQASLPTTNLYEGRIITHKGQVYIYYNGSWLSKVEFSDLAEDLVGRPEVYHEEFAFQPTANTDSVRDGLATVKSIKGNSVVTNQRVPMTDKYVANPYCSMTVLGEREVKVTPTSNTNNGGFTTQSNVRTVVGHKYFISFDIKGDISYTSEFLICNWSFGLFSFSITDAYQKYAFIKDCVESYPVGLTIRLNNNAYYLKNYMLIDLTLMCGAGNEPTTVEEFERLFPNLPSEYNAGSLLNLNADSIKSIGFNAFNGEYAQVLGGMQYYLGGDITSLRFKEHLEDEGEIIEIPSDNLYTPDTNGYLVATGDNICINLSHSGYRNGEYEPYKESILNLPIKQYFPNGMKSAGDVRDKIVWDEKSKKYKAVRRVGAIDMSSLHWTYNNGNSNPTTYPYGYFSSTLPEAKLGCFLLTPKYIYIYGSLFRFDLSIGNYIAAPTVYVIDSNYTDVASFRQSLQGQILYYELATPIETIIDDYDLIEYEVSDFGTEEIIADEPTTPIVADIQYGFNAIDVIRNNLFSIKEIFKLLLTKLSLTGGTMSGAIDMSTNPFVTAGFEHVEELPTNNNFIGRQVFYNNKPYYFTGKEWITFPENSGGGGATGDFWNLLEANPETDYSLVEIRNRLESVFPLLYEKYGNYLNSRNIYVDLSKYDDSYSYIMDLFGDINEVPIGVRYHIFVGGYNNSLKIDFPLEYSTNWSYTHTPGFDGYTSELYTIPYSKAIKIEFIKLSDSFVWVDVENYGGMPGYSTATATNSEESTTNIVNYCNNNNIDINYNKDTGNAIFNLVDILSSITTKLK